MKNKKWISILLAVVMVITLIPMTALAADETVTVANGMTFSKDTTNADIESSWGKDIATISENSDGSFTVTLLKNVTLKEGATSPITFGIFRDGKDQPMMILDLNGHTVSGKTIVISNMGNLTIKDSVGTGKVIYDGGEYLATVQNAGYLLKIDGGTFECKGANSVTYNAAISSAASTQTIINGGTFEGNNAGALIAYGNTTINGGTFNGGYGVVSKKASSGAGSITFPEDSTAVINADKMALVVHGDGTVNGTITVEGGTFNAQNVVGRLESADASNVTITGGSYTADPTGFVKGDESVASFKGSSSTDAELYIVGENNIANKAADVADGDTVRILSGDVKLDITADNVTVVNEGEGNVVINNEPVEKGEPIVTCIHEWGEPVWKWADDNASATATFTCKKNADHVEIVSASVTSKTTAATCTVDGKTVYTASVSFNGKDYTVDKTVSIPAAGHGETELKNFKEATCTQEGYTGDKVCKICGEVVVKGIATEKLAHSYKDGKCTVCGAVDPNYDAETPKTGDDMNLLLFIVLLLVSIGGIAGAIIYYSRRRTNR